MIMRPIGIHIRLKKGLLDVVSTVQELDLKVAQSFLMTESNQYISLNDRLIHNFKKAKKQQDFLYFVHAAYWSSLADVKSKTFASLQQEVAIAQDLGSDGIVIHIGASKSKMSVKDKAKYIAESVNTITQQHPDMNLLLENSPHAGRNFGGDIQDFAVLLNLLEDKSKVKFCIDTAHAYVFGYDIAKEDKMIDFVNLLDEVLPQQSIALLHFNDSADGCGSYIDKHEVPGKGMIGKKSLQLCMNHKFFKELPIIIEPSGNCSDNLEQVIKDIRSWK